MAGVRRVIEGKGLLTTRRSRVEFHISFPVRGYTDASGVRLNSIATVLNTPMSFVSFNNLPNSSANVLAIKQQQPPPVVDLDVLQAASRVLQEQLHKDTQIIPDHGDMFAYSAYLHFRSVSPFPYAKQPEVPASTAFSRMIIECHSSRENWRESQRVYSSISLVRDVLCLLW